MELAFALPRLGAATLLMARRLSLGAWLPWGSLAMAVRRPAFVIRLPLLLSALRQRRFLAARVRVAIAGNDDERQSPRMVLLRTTSDLALLVSYIPLAAVLARPFEAVCRNKCYAKQR